MVKATKLTQEVIFIIDRSGSMEPKIADVVGGFNTYVDDLKLAAKEDGIATRFTLVTFNFERTTVLNRVPVNEVRKWTARDYRPAGSTALLDAVQGVLTNFAGAQGQLEFGDPEAEQPAVLCVIVTDGEENASRKAKNEDVKALVELLEAKGNWTFVYLGANQDAWSQAAKFGVSAGSSVTIEDGQFNIAFKYLAEKSVRARQYAQETGNKRTDNFLATDAENLKKGKGAVGPDGVDRVGTPV